MRAGIRALADDPNTRVIVLISKPPAANVATSVLDVAKACGKPTVVHFLGASAGTIGGDNLHAAESLAEAADVAVALATDAASNSASSKREAATSRPTTLSNPGAERRATLGDFPRLLEGLATSERRVLGLFTGGTFCYEAQLAFLRRDLHCRSNAPAPHALPLDGTSVDHVFIDMGDDEYTRGRPHPMIDPSLRNAAIRDAATDATIAVLLFDVVLGYGSHPNPAEELVDALRDAQRTAATQGRKLIAIGHVCGTDGDPQDRTAQIELLRSAGAIVADSNIQAASIAADLAATLAQAGTVNA
jgi:hypothetical protein